MKYVKLSDTLSAPVIAAGCMRIASFDAKTAENFVNSAIDCGVNFFDHADIYGRYACEKVFGQLLKLNKALRPRIILQTKCGIVPGKMFDFSYEHIISSAENSLKNLNTDYLDVLLLHRPDALMEPEEVARAFDKLCSSGKVRHFGVSNQHPAQIELLKTALKQPLIINQLQFSAAFTGMLDAGFNVNMKNLGSLWHDGGILEYSRIKDMAVQAWSPFQFGFFEGVFVGSEKYPELNITLNALAEKYNTTPSAIAVAFILRHPAKWQVVTGTTKPERIKEAAQASDITLTREEWYKIYITAGNKLP